MAYKTILLCLNEVERMSALIAAARKLGAVFQAHIVGVYVIPAVQVYPSAALAAVPDIYDGNRKYYLDQMPKVQAAFEDAMKDDGLAFSFHKVESTTPLISNEVIDQGRSADLIVVSATNPSDTAGVEYDFVERLVIAAGRPVLVLPFTGKAEVVLDDVVLGWDGGREAARAAFDAMPILRKAKRVRITRVDEAPRGSLSGGDIAETLARHGVKAEIANATSDGMNSGETLLRSAKDAGSGLVVMGAYGHSRFTEFVFGGATRHVIRNLDLPVLMSH